MITIRRNFIVNIPATFEARVVDILTVYETDDIDHAYELSERDLDAIREFRLPKSLGLKPSEYEIIRTESYSVSAE